MGSWNPFKTNPSTPDNGNGGGGWFGNPAEKSKGSHPGARRPTTKGSGPNNDGRGKKDKGTGFRGGVEKGSTKGGKPPRGFNVTNKTDPKKLDKYEAMIDKNDNIVTRDPRGGFNIRHPDGTTEHRHQL